MTTTVAASTGRTTIFDRIARWTLDSDGDLYGDERERLRWYEGIAFAANLQWIAVPWAAAVLVWTLGRPAVLPLAVVLATMYLPMMLCYGYVQRRRVDTTVRQWTAKRVILMLLGGPPYVLFVFGCMYAVLPAESSFLRGARIGAVMGTIAVIVSAAYTTYRNRHRAPVIEGDDD
ncbi:MAG TPA: hypothetical protein VK453_19075 [Micromonosporaceae bacterium]|nr:hypothetical protein [Micromonosporaceae bacterium]